MCGWTANHRAARASAPFLGLVVARLRDAPRSSLLGLTLVACAASAPLTEPTQPPAIAASVAPVPFAFETLDSKPLSTESLRGRISAIGFITTYDVASQAQARFLAAIARQHVPRINVALLVLEAPDNVPLVQAFTEALPFKGPVAMADAATIAGKGPFAGLHHVPAVVLLDRRGAEVWRSIGLTDEAALEQAIRRVEAAE